MSNGKLDSPNLDDRTWKDIVDEAKALIPKYAPEWTDHNPSDLGITLIELFAWIVEGMIYRLNRVPGKNFIEFLNLLGITRDPATPASTFLTYRLAPGTSPTVIPKGSLAATQQTEKEEGIVFETDEKITVLPINLKTAFTIKDNICQNVSADLITSPLSKLSLDIPGTGTGTNSVMIILGFDSSSNNVISLLFGFDKPAKKEKKDNQNQNDPIKINLLYSNTTAGTPPPESWHKVEKVIDGTSNFQKNGNISFQVLGDWISLNPSNWEIDKTNESLYWIGIKIENLQADPINIVLRHILFNSVSATNAITITQPELLGVSNGKRFQSFELKNRPLFKKAGVKDPYDHLVIQVRKPEEGSFGPWNTWTHCDDFNRGKGEYYRLNPVAGTISFGDYDLATSPEGYGTIPPVDSEIRAQIYRYVVGGVKSNVPPNTINSIRTPVPGVISVTNPGAAKGGMDEEDIEETKRRGPEILRNRYRAVTVEDYEYLAREASRAVKKVRCLPPRLFTTNDNPPTEKIGEPWTYGCLNRSTGNINVIIIPYAPLNERTPMPSEELLQEVSDYLDERRTVASKLCVNCPRYLPIHVTVNISIWKKAVDDKLITDLIIEDETPNTYKSHKFGAEIKAKIKEFLHPILGGHDGKGWEVGQHITISTLFDYIKPSPEIGFISSLKIRAENPLYKNPERPPGFPIEVEGVWVKLADYEIICTDVDHTVTFDIS